MSRLRSNKVVNQAGTGAPELTYGAVVPGTGTISGAGKVSIGGSITAGSFHGDGSALTGVGDPSAIKDGSNVKVQAISTGANVTGNLAATGNVSASGNVTAVDGTFSGNLTVQGTTTTIDTAVTEVDSLNVEGSVGIGTTGTPEKLTVAGDILIRPSSGNVNSGDLALKFGRTNLGDGNNQQKTSIVATPSGGGWGMHDLHFCLDSASDLNNVQLSDSKFVIKNNGAVGITSTAPRVALDIRSADAIAVPVGTTAERPTAAAGMFRYNSDEGKFEGYTTEWGEIGGGGGGAAITTAAHVANNAVVTLNLNSAQDHKVTATGICTITCTGGTEAVSHTIRIINSGSATVGFSTYFLFPSGNTPVLPSGDGAINLVSFTVNRVGAAGTQLLTGASLNFS
jgi:hypothetical protein